MLHLHIMWKIKVIINNETARRRICKGLLVTTVATIRRKSHANFAKPTGHIIGG